MTHESKDAPQSSTSYVHQLDEAKARITKLKQESINAYERGVSDGRRQALSELTEIALRTDGAGVWRALFTEMLKGK